MGVESSPLYPADLELAWPLETDPRSEGAEHLRNVKSVISSTFSKVGGAALEQSMFDSIYPIGRVMVGIDTEGSRPDDDVGGTWQLVGRLTVDATGAEAALPSGPDLRVWLRTA